ncbi:MAG: SAM-dependent chlorinase/fluorinase [Candidatus Lokiarchaeota archaeon]|nr:SAM-dependent chlorinase/fluorinase [Candidatus Lokiarchaeota archaeon]
MVDFIGLITDFGLNGSHYVASMKGAILKINPLAKIIDISHAVTSYSIIEASFILKSSYSYFPEKTVFVVVVDPGVGSSREILALKTKSNQVFIGPNNGIFGNIFEMNEINLCIKIENEQFFIKPTSKTFQGRDIMAPIAAYITSGVELRELGTEFNIENIKSSPLDYEIFNYEKKIKCYIQYIDEFGNGITNFPINEESIKNSVISLKEGDLVTLEYKNQTFKGTFTTHFSENPLRSLLFLKGSAGYLEVSMNQENAANHIGFKVGDLIFINL